MTQLERAELELKAANAMLQEAQTKEELVTAKNKIQELEAKLIDCDKQIEKERGRSMEWMNSFDMKQDEVRYLKLRIKEFDAQR